MTDSNPYVVIQNDGQHTPSALEPRTGWAMGNAGIIRELLRFARASSGTDPTYALPWPDHPAAAPLTHTPTAR